MVRGVSPTFCAASASVAAGAGVLHLVLGVDHVTARLVERQLLLDLGGDLLEGLHLARLDLYGLDQHRAETALNRRADIAFLERESGIGDGRIDDACLRQCAEIGVGILEAALFGDGFKARAAGDLLGRRFGFIGIREQDLPQLAAFRRAELVRVVVIDLARVGVRDCLPLGEALRRQLDKDDAAVFGRAEQNLALLEIFGEFVGARRRDIARLCRTERQIADGPRLVLELLDRCDQRVRRRDVAGNRVGEFATDQRAALLGDEARFGKAGVADQRLEAVAVELAGRAGEILVVDDLLGDLGVGQRQPQVARAFVESGFGHELADQLAVETQRPRLIRRDWAAHAAAQGLQAVVVVGTELLDADFSLADLGDRREAESPEDVADAPDGKADHQKPHDHGHDNLAEPISGGFLNTAKHRYA